MDQRLQPRPAVTAGGPQAGESACGPFRSSAGRFEELRFLEGRGQYLDDVPIARALSLCFLRSPHAHAAIREIDAEAARDRGALVVTGDDLQTVVRPLKPRLERPGFVPTTTPPLALGKTRFCGEAVAAIAAGDPYAAADARDAVRVMYELLPAVTCAADAVAQERVLFSHAHRHGDVEGAFAGADVVVGDTFTHGRMAPCPLEPRGMIAAWDGDALTVWVGTQRPHVLRAVLAEAFDIAVGRVRVIVPDVGGAFGLKAVVCPEDLAVAAVARLARRPVKWIEDREENLRAAPQAREQRIELEIAACADGRIRALRARLLSDGGAYHSYPQTHALEPLGSAAILPGPYRVPAYAYQVTAVATHKPPLGGYRGVGMVMGVFAMERTLDLLAEKLDIDPAEIRRRNLIEPAEYPFLSSSGLVYDSGDFPRLLNRALETAGYESLRREQDEARSCGRYIGVGLACYTESTGMGAEAYRRRGVFAIPGPDAITVTIDADASVRCVTSLPCQGQGHASVLKQLLAEGLGIPTEGIAVHALDTHMTPPGSGTMASRGAVAIAGLAERVNSVLARKMTTIAASLLEASPGDVVLKAGHAHVRGVPQSGVPIARIAQLAYTPPLGGLPDGMEPGLTATVSYDPPGPVFSGGVQVAVVEADAETGVVEVLRHVIVEDCGRILDATIVDGQIHGAVAQGIGEALGESLVYDPTGQPLATTLMEYALRRAGDVPSFEVDHVETLSPLTRLGVKGMGEGGTIGAPAAIANAVAAATRHLRASANARPVNTLPIWPSALARFPAAAPVATARAGLDGDGNRG